MQAAMREQDISAFIESTRPGQARCISAQSVAYLDSTLPLSPQDLSRSTRAEVRVLQRVGRYRIRGRLGGGSYGEVFQASVESGFWIGGDVAIKCLRLEEGESPDERAQLLIRFQREREILSQIDHPNVVRLIDSGDEPVPYLVMEFIPGGTLRKLVQPGLPLEVGRVLRIGRGILRGLAALHEKRVVHRDLKPANVLLRENHDPVIGDFGLARALDLNAITIRSTVLGTLAYMAPEQLQGEPADERADIYAAGGILYEMLSGRIPFEGDALQELIRRICEEKPVPLATLRPDLPAPLVSAVERCLEKDPARRFSNVRELLRVLQAHSR
jgi:serine/threonine-protein kinase